jgi:hypothetical protein
MKQASILKAVVYHKRCVYLNLQGRALAYAKPRKDEPKRH